MVQKARFIIMLICGVSIVLGTATLVFYRLQQFLPWQLVSAQDNAMHPIIAHGGLAVTGHMVAEKLDKGVIVSFTLPGSTDHSVIRRVERIINDNGERLVVTKADAHSGADTWLMLDKQITRQLLFQIPLIGYWLDFLNTPPGTISFVLIPGLVIMGWELRQLLSTLSPRQLAPSV